MKLGSGLLASTLRVTRPLLAGDSKVYILNTLCRGIVTTDVLELGLSRGAITTWKLEGVSVGQGTRGFILVRPLTVKVKAYVQFEVFID